MDLKKFVRQSIRATLSTVFARSKDVQFFHNYFNTIDAIAKNRCGHCFCRQSLRIRLVYVVFFLLASHCLWMYYWPQTSHYDRLVHFDIVAMMGLPRLTNLELCLVSLEMIYTFEWFYFKLVDNPVLTIFRRTMLNGDNSFALSSKPIRRTVIRAIQMNRPYVVMCGIVGPR